MSRNLLALASVTSIAAFSLLAAPAAHATDSIPAYFFSDWTIDTNCVQVGDDPNDHAEPGLKFRVSQTSLSSNDQTYAFEPMNNGSLTWSNNWSTLRLQYRAGTPMSTVPADFACVPGEEASSPFLAMTGYTQTTEPYYEFEHWYGLATINGEAHHVLVFPRHGGGDSSVVVILQDAGSGANTHLDTDGSIHGHEH